VHKIKRNTSKFDDETHFSLRGAQKKRNASKFDD